MTRHLPAVMGAFTLLFAACTWLARVIGAARIFVVAWVVVTALAFLTTIALAIITPGSSDE